MSALPSQRERPPLSSGWDESGDVADDREERTAHGVKNNMVVKQHRTLLALGQFTGLQVKAGEKLIGRVGS